MISIKPFRIFDLRYFDYFLLNRLFLHFCNVQKSSFNASNSDFLENHTWCTV